MKTSKIAPGHEFKKNAGSLRAGFLYQDLVAIETLINSYRNRNLYEWVQLEAEGSEFKSVEDVVTCKPNGLYELIQVKFTVNPDEPANHLSWKWLIEKKKKNGKSLLEKWASTTLRHKEAGTLAKAALKTDRVPDAEFGKCLRDGRIDCSMLSAEIKARVEEQIGSQEKAMSFFESFEFIHSLPRLDDLEDNLRQRVASDTDEGGWHKFRNQVQRWSTQKGQPVPDGKIKYIHLRQVFSIERSRPIPQDFQVPSAYCVPDKNFDKVFLEKICNSDGIAVLWGPPGSGKSTYLSHCVARIDRKNAVCIRHHYFLSPADRSEGRFHCHAIFQSLKDQLEKAMPELVTSHTSLGNLLDTVACQLKSENRRLIVIIDGLDHVWRDHRDREDMEALFDALLPLPPNVRLVVGTQKIAIKNLPAKLPNALPSEEWTELPLMTYAAVHSWLRSQDRAGRLHLRAIGRERRGRVFGKVARAFHNISHGLPLHLIYSFEEVAHTGKAITAENVASLPACPTGDIRDYYRSIWERKSAKGRAVLHVLAGLEFGPPPFALHDCFGRSDESFEAFSAINHLLDLQETEVRPFHGSLFDFLRDLPEHREIFLTHAADVLEWLESLAPAYWRWAWLWIAKAQLGDPSDLLAGPSREWAIDALVAGYPLEQVTAILDRAEKVAFDAFDLTRFLSLRLLKERTLDGPKFQTPDWPLFREVGVSLSNDSYVEAILRAELLTATDGILPYIVRSADGSIREQLAEDALDELNRRITLYDRNTGNYNRPSELTSAIVAVLAYFTPENAQSVVSYAQQIYDSNDISTIYAQAPILDSKLDEAITFAKAQEDSDELITTYTRESILAFNFDNVFEAGKLWSGFQLDRDVLTVLCFEGLAPTEKSKLKALTHPAVRCLALLKGGVVKRSRTQKDLSSLFLGGDGPDAKFAQDTRFVLHEIFFAALAAALSGGKAQGWSKIPADAGTTWLSEAVRALELLAGDIAERWLTLHQWPSLQEIYDTFELCPPASHSFTARRRFKAVLVAIRDIAIDLCTIARGLDSNAFIDTDAISLASKSFFWLDGLWLEAFSERRLLLHTQEAAQAFVKRAGDYLDKTITNSNERTTAAIKLAMFASDYGLVPLAHKELSRAAGCLLGYGHHKDMFAFEVLRSLELLTESGDAEAQKTILDLAGEFEALTVYTDGDETRYARENYYKAIAAHFPERASNCYAYLIHKEEWRYAEAVATAVVETNQVESQTGLALLESYIAPGEIRALEKTDSASRTYIDAALAAVRRKTGRVIRGTPENEESQPTGYMDSEGFDSSPEDAELSVPDPGDFPPGRLQGFLNEVPNMRHYDDQGEPVTAWLRFWAAAGCADEALTALEAAVSDTRFLPDRNSASDAAFEIALEAQGRSKAFPWLVRAHFQTSGWLRWFSNDDETERRLRVVAQHYRGQWREFITNTACPRYTVGAASNGIYIGLSRLVYFLIEVGELDLARDYALEMARIFKAELEEQPIVAPEWSK